MYIRFETRRAGRGLYHEAADLSDQLCYVRRDCRLNRRDGREFLHVYWRLRNRVAVPPPEAYRDTRCRYPQTWFKEAATAQVALAWRACLLLNRAGCSMRPIRARDPGLVLWEDDVQIVVRPHDRLRARPARKPREGKHGWNGDRATIRRWQFER